MEIQEIVAKLSEATVKLFLIKKIKKGKYEAFRLPNGIDEDIKIKYVSNLENFIKDKTFIDFDFVHEEKNTVVKMDTQKLDLWIAILDSVLVADANNTMLNKENFSEDYAIILIDYVLEINGAFIHTYMIAKYIKTDTWYKKGIKFAFTTNNLVEKKDDIIVLNGCIDVLIASSNAFILNERNFETLFNFYETAKKLIEDTRPAIEAWPLMAITDAFFNKVFAGKTRVLKLANAIKNSKTDWSNISPTKVKQVLESNDKFVGIAFDDRGRIVCNENNVDLIIDIIREVYSKQLFTDEIIETKGV